MFKIKINFTYSGIVSYFSGCKPKVYEKIRFIMKSFEHNSLQKVVVIHINRYFTKITRNYPNEHNILKMLLESDICEGSSKQ